MKKSVWLWSLSGFAITSFLGTLLHFLYEWTGEAIWIAPFSGVNESTWEHMKLLFWPMFIFAIVESFFFKDKRDFWCIKLRGILLGLVLIPTIFYTYNGVIGVSPDWINIGIFFISTAVAYVYETRLFELCKNCKNAGLAVFILIAIAAMFVIFTFKTPEIGIFKDPISGGYGIL